MHKSTKLSKARVPCPLNPAIVEALSKRALAGSSLIPPFQQTLLSRSESTTMHREIFLDAPSGSASPQMLQSRSRNDTQSSNYSASNTTLSTMTVTVPVVNSSALHDLRSERKNTRADSTDSASTLPGELLLYDTSFNRKCYVDCLHSMMTNHCCGGINTPFFFPFSNRAEMLSL